MYIDINKEKKSTKEFIYFTKKKKLTEIFNSMIENEVPAFTFPRHWFVNCM